MREVRVAVTSDVHRTVVQRRCGEVTRTNDSSFDLWGMNLMQQSNMTAAREVTWDDETADWQTMDMIGQLQGVKPRQSWLTRQLIAAIWILIAWAVGTLVFELGAIG